MAAAAAAIPRTHVRTSVVLVRRSSSLQIGAFLPNYWYCGPPGKGAAPNCEGSSICGFTGLNCSAEKRVKRMPTPSIRARRTPPMTADPTIAPVPFRTAKMAPVRAPLVMEFQGSSFLRIFTIVQSIVENKPPQTAKFPPMIGALSLMAPRLPSRRRLTPEGAFLNPLML